MFSVSISNQKMILNSKKNFQNHLIRFDCMLTVHILVEMGWSTRFQCAIGRIQWRMGNVLARPSPVMMMSKGMCLNCRHSDRPPNSYGHRLHSLSPLPYQRPSLAPPWTDRHLFVSHLAEAAVFLWYWIRKTNGKKVQEKQNSLIIFFFYSHNKL